VTDAMSSAAPEQGERLPLRPEPQKPVLAPQEPAIRCTDVWKQYYFYAHRPRKLKDAILQTVSLRRKPKPAPVWAIQNLDLRVYPGEIVGVVGHNGAGKSTLLKLLSRILKPTRGEVQIRGRLSAVIELGAGFHEDLSARENVYLAASLLGLSGPEIDALYPKIVDFAELAEHMETPVKYFSSGMHARLGFSIAVNTNPDVLLIDEVLAVGDANFQPKCIATVKRFRAENKAILFVSHDLQTVRNLCTRAVWLKNGLLMHEGPPRQTVDTYLEHYWPGCTKDLAHKWTDE
jgi:ABC-type polysaccharide/polyol phosphate transport system ATPase subunit